MNLNNKNFPNLINKKSIPIRQFEYAQSPSKPKLKQFISHYDNHLKQFQYKHSIQTIPIQILKNKIIQSQQYSYNKDDQIKQSQSNNNPELQQRYSFSKIFQYQKNHYQPNLHIFDRYNYQNYQNYSYKNPYQHTKYEEIIKHKYKNKKYQFPTSSARFKQNVGQHKNLQIVFCQNKFQSFVNKINQDIQTKQIQSNKRIVQPKSTKKINNERQKSMTNIKKTIIEMEKAHGNQLLNKKNLINWNYPSLKSHDMVYKDKKHSSVGIKPMLSSTSSKVINNNKNVKLMFSSSLRDFNTKNTQPNLYNSTKKSTLQNFLAEFKALQKLTQIQEQQHSQLNQKFNYEDLSKTVYVSLLVDKYIFLKKLNKLTRNKLLKALFKLSEVKMDTKISVHDFMKFCRIFIDRDQSQEELGNFIVDFLVEDSQNEINQQKMMKIVIELGKSDKTSQVASLITEIFHSFEQDQILTKLKQNNYLHSLLLDIIFSK